MVCTGRWCRGCWHPHSPLQGRVGSVRFGSVRFGSVRVQRCRSGGGQLSVPSILVRAAAADVIRATSSLEKLDGATQSGGTGKTCVSRQQGNVECLGERDVARVVAGESVSQFPTASEQ